MIFNLKHYNTQMIHCKIRTTFTHVLAYQTHMIPYKHGTKLYKSFSPATFSLSSSNQPQCKALYLIILIHCSISQSKLSCPRPYPLWNNSNNSLFCFKNYDCDSISSHCLNGTVIPPVVPGSGDTGGVFSLLLSFLPLVVFAGGASLLSLAAAPFLFLGIVASYSVT